MSRPKKHSAVDRLMVVVVIAVPVVAIGWFAWMQIEPPANLSAPQSAVPPASVALSLDDASLLPSSVTTAEIVPFSFTIKNTGATAATYQYKVSVLWSSGEDDVIDENSISLAAGASKQISEGLKFETASAKAQVTIETEQPKQDISFALPRTP